MTEKKLTEFGLTSIIDICIRGAAEVAEITGVAKAKADSLGVCFSKNIRRE
jgi:hypothetical protein